MKIELNKVTLNYKKIGTGDPVILLHGNGEDHHIFDKLIERLYPFFTIYAIDSRNHGESSRSGNYSYTAMASDIYQFIDLLELRNISILGFSDGAIIALLLSLEYHNLFTRMVLLGVNLHPSDFKKDVYDDIVAEYNKTGDLLLKMMLEQSNIELERLREIHIPTLLVAGEDDIYEPTLYARMQAVMPNAKMKIFDGHDHGSYIINQDIIYTELEEFFKIDDRLLLS